MTDAASIDGSVNAGATGVERPPVRPPGILSRMFGTPLNAVLSVASLGGLLWILPGLLRWLVIDAAFLPAEPRTCQAAAGACWSFVVAKSGQILFGIYPPDERWRPGSPAS